ncbi:MAG: phosphodiester glycosidase family protein [Anaerolineales bacterium]|nr:phosphodiester glycosidase family protein [Anaerolineales bacterium]
MIWLALLASFAWTNRVAFAQTPVIVPTPDVRIPVGFQLLDSAPGIQLYKKDYPNGSPDYVQVIDLSAGARLKLLHGQITEPRPTRGSYGGPDPRMTSPALQTYWQQVLETDAEAFCVTNGGFFYMPEYPTRLAFPLKVDGQMITEGWGIKTYIEQKLILELWPDRANIRPLSAESLYDSEAPNILGGLTEDANKRAKYAVGRTFIGIADYDDHNGYETVLILNTQTALQSSAAAVLRDFGAEKVMMLDGGGSTQLLCKSGWHIRSDRPIPQAIAAIAAQPPRIAAQPLEQSQWPVLVEGEGFPFYLKVRNTGVLSWTIQTTQLILDPSPWGVPQWLPLEGEIQPGASAVFSDTLAAFRKAGLYQVKVSWGIRHGGETYYGEPLMTQAVVLPSALRDQRQALQSQIEQWRAHSSPEQVEAQVERWLEEKNGASLPTAMVEDKTTRAVAEVHPQDAVWIPLIMLPIVIILGFMVSRRTVHG